MQTTLQTAREAEKAHRPDAVQVSCVEIPANYFLLISDEKCFNPFTILSQVPR